jgi:ubiquinone/menaquinone biosynthesis C-methylase UbiE
MLAVLGLDLSADMLAIAAEKATTSDLTQRLRLEYGDMRRFDLAGREFGLVIVPFRAFQFLLTPEDQLAALTAFRRPLRAGGILALHLFDPDLRLLASRIRSRRGSASPRQRFPLRKHGGGRGNQSLICW